MRWKWVLGLMGLFFLVLIVTGYIIVASYDYNKLKPRISRAVHEATGRELTLGDIKVGIGLRPSLEIEKVSFQNAPWGSRPEMAKIKHFEIQLALLPLIRREFQFKRLILVEPDIFLETDLSGKSNLDFKPSEKPKPPETKAEEQEKLPPLAFDAVRIEKGLLAYKDGQGGKTYSVKIDSLTAAFRMGERPIELDVQGMFNGRPFEVRGSAGPLAAVITPGKAWPVNLTAKVAGATVTVEGSITDVLREKGIDLTVNAGGPSIRKVAEFAGVTDIPDPGPFKLTAKVANPVGKINLTNLKASLGENDITGSLQLNLSGKKPQIVADLSSPKLDLRPLLGKTQGKPTESKQPAQSKNKGAKVFPNDPLPLDALKAVDAQIKMQAGNLRIPGMVLTNLSTDVRLEKGDLTAKQVKFLISGGTIDGNFSLHPQGKDTTFLLNLKVDQLNVSSLLKELEVKPILEGKLDAEIALNGRGGSVAEWMAGLNGRAITVMGQGRLHNQYLDLLGVDLARSILRLINPFKTGEDYTTFNCFVTGLEIKNGLAICSALVLDTNQISVAGGGDVNLKDESLNLSLHPLPKKGVGAGELGKVSLSLGELSKPFKLGGTLAKPSLAIDTGQTLTAIGKAVGGVALFGPAGVLAALASASPDDKNPCLTALESAQKGGKASGKEKAEEKTQGSKKAPEEGKEGSTGVGQRLKKVFKY